MSIDSVRRFLSISMFLLTLSGLSTNPSEAQVSQDPLIGGYILGNSAELFMLRLPPMEPSLVGTLYDCSPGLDSSGDYSIQNYTAVGSFDCAMADIDADGKEEAVAVSMGADSIPVLSVTRFTRGTHGLETTKSTPLAAAKMKNGGNPRVLRAVLDRNPADEVVIAYWTSSETIRLIAVRVDSASLDPIIVGTIADVPLPASLAADARFDIAVGDFDRDGLDEVFLAKVNAGETILDNAFSVTITTHLFGTVYDYDPAGSQFIRCASTAFDAGKSMDALGIFPQYSDVRTGGLVAAAGDFNKDGRDEPVVCWSWGVVSNFIDIIYQEYAAHAEQQGTPLQVSENLDSLWFAPVKVFSCDAYDAGPVKTSISNWGAWPISAATGDLNGDGSDELVTAGLQNVNVFRSDSLVKFTSIGTRVLPNPGGLVLAGRSRRMVAVADVDADSQSSRWHPEIVVTNSGLTFLSAYGMAWEVIGVAVDTTTLALGTMVKKAGGYEFPRSMIGGDQGSIDWAIALGDANGDAIRLRNPRKLIQQSVLQPLVVLNALPVHFDVFNDSTFDVCKTFNQNAGSFSAVYEKQVGQTVQFSTQLKTDWGVSSTLKAGGKFLGIGADAHFTAKYGENFSKKNETNRTVTVTETAQTSEDDRICATVTDYEYWEYPLYQGGESRGDVVVVIPRLQDPPMRWVAGKSWDAMWYTPRHEVGNILSYMPATGIPAETDLDTLLHLFTPAATAQKAGTNWEIKFDEFMSASDEKTCTMGFEAGASVSGWGFEASLEGHYDREELSTHTSSATNGIKVTLHVGEIDTKLGEVEYTVGPCAYWGKNGALVIDYAVTPTASSGGGLETWWEGRYGHKPDPAFNLPWRLDPEKGNTLTNPAKRWLSKSIRVSPSVLHAGEQTTIRARVYNFSLLPLPSGVTVRFFAGDPDSGGVPIVGDGGIVELKTVGTIAARGYQNMQMSWTVPSNLSGVIRVYGAIDQDAKVSEVHEDNNKGFAELTVFPSTGVAENPQASVPAQYALYQNYPNPFNPSTIIRFELPSRVRTQLKVYDILGREVETLVDAVEEAGVHTLWFDASRLASGVYICRLQAGQFSQARKLLFIK